MSERSAPGQIVLPPFVRQVLHGGGFWPALPAVVFLVVFLVLPMLTLLAFGFVTIDRGRVVGETFTLQYLQSALGDNLIWRLAWRSFYVAVISTVLALILAYPVAYLFSQTSGLWRTLILIAVISPLLTSALVRAYAWLVILGGRRGLPCCTMQRHSRRKPDRKRAHCCIASPGGIDFCGRQRWHTPDQALPRGTHAHACRATLLHNIGARGRQIAKRHGIGKIGQQDACFLKTGRKARELRRKRQHGHAIIPGEGRARVGQDGSVCRPDGLHGKRRRHGRKAEVVDAQVAGQFRCQRLCPVPPKRLAVMGGLALAARRGGQPRPPCRPALAADMCDVDPESCHALQPDFGIVLAGAGHHRDLPAKGQRAQRGVEGGSTRHIGHDLSIRRDRIDRQIAHHADARLSRHWPVPSSERRVSSRLTAKRATSSFRCSRRFGSKPVAMPRR